MIPSDVWDNVHEFLGVEGKYLFLAPVSRQWKERIIRHPSRNTNLKQMMASSSTIKECCQCERGMKTLAQNAWSYLAVMKNGQKEFNILADEIKNTIEWDRFSVHTAAIQNNANFFHWLRKTTLEWDASTALSSFSQDENENQKLEFLKNMLGFGYSPTTWRGTTIAAARLGSVKLIRWLQQLGCDMDSVAQVLAEEGHLEALQWANTNGIPLDQHTLEAALYGGNHRVVTYVKGYDANRNTHSK